MKIIVKFSPDIGLPDLQKQVSPNQSVENLEVLISLNYDKMNQCKLVYQGRPLNNKAQTLRNIMNGSDRYEVTVATKNELQAYAQQIGSFVQLFQQYPLYFTVGIVILIFLILFLMGQ